MTENKLPAHYDCMGKNTMLVPLRIGGPHEGFYLAECTYDNPPDGSTVVLDRSGLRTYFSPSGVLPDDPRPAGGVRTLQMVSDGTKWLRLHAITDLPDDIQAELRERAGLNVSGFEGRTTPSFPGRPMFTPADRGVTPIMLEDLRKAVEGKASLPQAAQKPEWLQHSPQPSETEERVRPQDNDAVLREKMEAGLYSDEARAARKEERRRLLEWGRKRLQKAITEERAARRAPVLPHGQALNYGLDAVRRDAWDARQHDAGIASPSMGPARLSTFAHAVLANGRTGQTSEERAAALARADAHDARQDAMRGQFEAWKPTLENGVLVVPGDPQIEHYFSNIVVDVGRHRVVLMDDDPSRRRIVQFPPNQPLSIDFSQTNLARATVKITGQPGGRVENVNIRGTDKMDIAWEGNALANERVRVETDVVNTEGFNAAREEAERVNAGRAETHRQIQQMQRERYAALWDMRVAGHKLGTARIRAGAAHRLITAERSNMLVRAAPAALWQEEQRLYTMINGYPPRRPGYPSPPPPDGQAIDPNLATLLQGGTVDINGRQYRLTAADSQGPDGSAGPQTPNYPHRSNGNGPSGGLPPGVS